MPAFWRARPCIGTFYIIKHYIMHIAYIERIIGRSDKLLIFSHGIEIAGKHHIVVVIAYCMENAYILQGIYVLHIIVQFIRIAIPKDLPSHISQGYGIKFI